MISSSLNRRVLSGVFLLPLTVFIVITGGLLFKLAVGICFGLAVKEWIRMTRLCKHTVRDAILGLAYLLIGFVAFIKLRTDFDQGLFFTVTLMFGVWASDIAAYFTGKKFGGPKLAPKISPNKTWAGFIGGTMGSGLTLLAIDYFVPSFGGKMGLDALPFAGSPFGAGMSASLASVSPSIALEVPAAGCCASAASVS